MKLSNPIFKKAPLRSNFEATLLPGGRSFFDILIQYIQEARDEIHFQLYIFDNDYTGTLIAGKLIEAAKRGVKVFVVIDSFGSSNFSEEMASDFEIAGIALKKYSPVLTSYKIHFGIRLHHKIFVFDKCRAIIGGVNISNKYSGYDNYLQYWLDFGVILTGTVVDDLHKICEDILARGLTQIPQLKTTKFLEVDRKLSINKRSIRVLQNEWLRGKFSISNSYRINIRRAQKSIYLVSSYFLPSNRVKYNLINAARRGVKVHIVLSQNSDIKLMKKASNYFYEALLKSGVNLYEWKESVLHAKIAVIDDNWSTIGSYNLNHLSDYGSIECNVEILDNEFGSDLRAYVEESVMPNSEEITLESFKKKYGIFSLFSSWISYQLIRISFRILFFLQKRENL